MTGSNLGESVFFLTFVPGSGTGSNLGESVFFFPLSYLGIESGKKLKKLREYTNVDVAVDEGKRRLKPFSR